MGKITGDEDKTALGAFYGTIALAFMIGAYYTAYKGISMFSAIYDSRNNIVQQQDVRGNEKPETYVEINGVKYYSHIDGKELSDVVRE